ncbi:MAG TPA: LD-carboxypeptidase, partial [Pyrinomonadaceae bacterium]
MKRRNFLTSGMASLIVPLLGTSSGAKTETSSGALARTLRAETLPADLIRPKALRPGDTVGVITPSTPVIDPDRLAVAERTLRYFGLKMKMGRNVGKRSPDYRSFVAERLDDLHAMFSDRGVS